MYVEAYRIPSLRFATKAIREIFRRSPGKRIMNMATRLLSQLARASALAAVMTLVVVGNAAVAQKKPAWFVICIDEKDAKTCRIVQKLFTEQGVKGKQRTYGKVLSLTVAYGGTPRQPVLVMDMPLGVDLRPGMVLRVDNRKEMTAPYLRCTGEGCTSRIALTPPVLAMLRRGSKLHVGFRPFSSNQTLVVDASLIGFSKAFARIR